MESECQTLKHVCNEKPYLMAPECAYVSCTTLAWVEKALGVI